MTHGGNVWQGGSPDSWLDYSANIRPGGPPDWVREALARGLDDAAYYPDPAMRAASEALAVYLDLPADCVRPTAGGISALDLGMGAADRQVVLLSPGFGEYEWLARNHGLQVRAVPLLKEFHAVADPAEVLRGAISPGTLMCLGNPVNPLGCAFPRGDMTRLLDVVEAADGWLMVDEAFISYCADCSIHDLVTARERLIVAGSMTKILGIPGVRLGYLCAGPATLSRLTARQLTWELNCVAAAVLRALPDHRNEVADEARLTAARREALITGLQAMGLYVYPSRAAFVLVDLGRPAEPIAAALKDQGILVRQCMDFSGVDDGNHLRLAVKDDRSNARLLAALREALTCAANH